MADLNQTSNQLDNLANKTATAAERIAALDNKTNQLYSDLERLNNITRNTEYSNGGMDIKEHESFRKELEKIEALMEKIGEAQFGDIDTSKVAALEKEYAAINNSTLQIKMNEAVAQNGLKVYIDYAKELKSYVNDIVKLMASGSVNPAHLGEHITKNTGSLRPYGINVRNVKDEDKTLHDNENRVILKDNVFELDEEKLREVGEEYAGAVKEFMNFLITFKTLTKEMGSTSALNSVSPRRFLTANGEIADQFKGILGIAGKTDTGFDEGVTTKNVSYKVGDETISRKIKQMQLPDDPNLGLFEKTNTERLEGFTDEKGEHLGYKGVTKGLEDVVNKVIESLAKLANYTPGLASTEVISGMSSLHNVGYTGTDLAKRMSYDSWLNSEDTGDSFDFDFDSIATDIKDMPILAIKSFNELSSTIEQVRGKLTEMGKTLPYSGSKDYAHDPLNGRRLGDQEEVDSFGNKVSSTAYLDMQAQDEAVKFSASISDNMSEAEKAAAEAAASFKNIVAEQATKTSLLKDIVDDNEERSADQLVFAGGATQDAYKSSSTKSGAVDFWGQARDQVKEIDNKQKEVEDAYKTVEDIFKSGEFNKLLEPVNEFNNNKPIEDLNSVLTQMMQSVQAFDKGSYARSATTPGKDGTVLFDKAKYLEFADKIGQMTKALLDNQNFQEYGNTDESISEISQNIETVTKSLETGRKSEAGNKLNSEYLKNALKESVLAKELEAREQNLTSGLLAGSDLANAQKKIELIKVELDGARQAIESINAEAEKNGISLEAATNKAETLKEVYWDVASALGSTADADKFFSQVNKQSQITGDNIRGIADQFGDRMTNLDMSDIAEKLKNVKNDLSLLSGGNYERSLSSSIRDSKGLSRAEQEVARYQNDAIREQLNNAKFAMTGSYDAQEEVAKNLNAEELRAGIENIKQSLANTGSKIEEIGKGDITGALQGQLINFKDRLGKIQVEFDKLTQGLTESSNVGQLRAVFENSKVLGNSLNTLNAQVELAANNAKQSSEADKQKAYDKYTQQRQADAQKIDNIKTQFSERESLISGMNTQGLDKVIDRIRILKTELDKALVAGNANKASAIWDAYISATDKVIGKSREVEEAQKRQAEAEKAQQEAIKKLLEETKNYVSTQEALAGKPMSFEAQAEYYRNQLPKFVEGTREYIEVLKLKNQAEARAAEAAERAAEEEKKAHQEALEAARSKVQGVLSTVKTLADGINRAINKIVSIIRTGISLVNRIISTAGKIINTLAGGVRSIITLFGSLSNRVRQIFGGADKSVVGLTGSINLLKGSATELRSKIMLLKGAFNAVFNNQFINKGKNLLTSIATLNTVIGAELTDNTIAWAQELERALGISATDLIADLKEISAVLYGLGMSSEDTALGAQNLGMMSRYLGMMGLAGGNVDQVMTKLASGMKGMTQAIDDLGLSVRDSQMQNFIKNLKNGTNELGKSLKEQGVDLSNMGDDFSALNEQARVYIRYAALIEQFKSNYDLSDFARQLNTVTGRLSILTQTWNSLATTVGVAMAKVGAVIAGYLIPIIRKLQVYVEGALVSIQRVFNNIGKFFGIDLAIGLDKALDSGANKLGGVDTSGIDDTNDKLDETSEKLDEVSDKAKKAGGNLQNFDRINNISTSSDSGSSSDDFDYSVLMNSALDSLKAYTDTADNYFDILDKNLTDTVNKIKEKLKEVANELTGRELDFGFDTNKIKTNLSTAWDNILKLVNSWGSLVIEIGLKIADDVNIGAIITKVSEVITKISEVANTVSNVLQPALDIFYETGIKPIMEYLGVETLNILDWFIDKLDELGKWFVDNKDSIYVFFEGLGEKALEVFGKIPEKVTIAVEAIKELVSVIAGAPNENALDEIDKGTDWGNVLSIISSLRDILGQLLDKLGEFATNTGLPWLQEQLDKLASWLKENKDKVVELVDKLAGIAWKSFKVFVDLVGKLIDYVVNNPDSVLTFFTALLGLKVASWFTSVAASIGLALTGMKGFTGLIGKVAGIGGAATGAAATAGTAGATAGAATAGAATATAGATTAAGGTAAAGGVALGPIAAVVAIVIALIAAVKDLWDTSERFRDSIKAVWDKIVEAFNNAKEKISEAFGNIKEAWDNFYKAYDNSFLKDLIAGIVSLLANYLGGALASLIDLVGTLFATIANLLADIINIVAGVFDVLGGLWNIIVGIFTLDGDKIKEGWGHVCTGLVEIVTGLIQGIVDIVGGVVGALIDAGSAMVGGLGQGISEAWTGFVEWVRGLFDGWIQGVKEFFGIHSPSTLFAEIGNFLVSGLFEGIKSAWEAFKQGVIDLCSGLVETVKSVFSGIGSFFSETFQNAKELATNAWADAQEKFNGIKENVVSSFNDIKDKVGSKFTEAKTKAVEAWGDAKETFAGIADKAAEGFNTLKDKVKGTFSDIKDSVSSAFNDIKTKASSIWDNIKQGVSNFGNSVYTTVTGKTTASTGYKITTNANGGSIAGGQLFIANENGVPELIGNIDGTGRTNVANNGMIIDAMQSGVFEAVYNAMAEVQNQTANRGVSGNSKVEINGFGLIDQSALRELARLLAPHFNSNNINIADTEFSIN